MENTIAINILFVESNALCCKEGCEKKCVVMDTLTSKRFCENHAPRIWLEKAFRNDQRIEQERRAIPRPCVVW